MKKITVRTKAAKKLRAGYPLLVAEDLNSPFLEDDFAQFFDEKGKRLEQVIFQNKIKEWVGF